MKKANLWPVGFLTIIITLIMSASLAMSDVTNVALNKSVTLAGGNFFENGWGGTTVVSPDTVVDGLFLPRSTQWDQGAVWWDSNDGAQRSVMINLLGTFSIESFIVQADDNDAYKLYYWNLNSSEWLLAYLVPAIGGWGMQTRPDPTDNTERYLSGAPITTNALKFEGFGGDLLYSVSEIQAYGTAVPEPTLLILLCSGLLGLLGFGIRFRR